MLDIKSARPDMITMCPVESVEYSILMLLSKSAIRSLFFPSCSIAIFCTLSRPFVPFGLDSGFRLLCVRLAVHVHSHLLFGRGRAALK